MELSESKSGNSLENNTGSENWLHRNSEKSIESITNWNLSEKRRTVETCGVCNRKFRKQKKVRNHIKVAHDSQSQESLKINWQ